MNAASGEWIAVALEEYKTLRQESLAAIEQMQRTVQIGLVAIGVLTAFGPAASRYGDLVNAGLGISAPIVATLVVVLRLDELQRTVNAGAHLAVLEQKIDRRVGDSPLTWESNIQREFDERKDRSRHLAISAVLLAAAAPTVALCVARLARNDSPWLWAVLAGVAAILGFIGWYQRKMLGEVADMHKTALRRLEEADLAAP